MKTRTPSAIAGAFAAAAALSLSACELRGDDSGADPAAVTADQPDEIAGTPTPSASATQPVSIIREDVAPVEVVEVPPEPFATTVPLPDGAELDTGALRALAAVLESEALRQPGWPVVVAGHTDSTGNDQANLRASRSRAEVVAAWLVEHGVADDRIVVIAFGEQNPVAPNALPDGSPNEAGRRTNRRVEISIAPPADKQAEKASAAEEA